MEISGGMRRGLWRRVASMVHAGRSGTPASCRGATPNHFGRSSDSPPIAFFAGGGLSGASNPQPAVASGLSFPLQEQRHHWSMVRSDAAMPAAASSAERTYQLEHSPIRDHEQPQSKASLAESLTGDHHIDSMIAALNGPAVQAGHDQYNQFARGRGFSGGGPNRARGDAEPAVAAPAEGVSFQPAPTHHLHPLPSGIYNVIALSAVC